MEDNKKGKFNPQSIVQYLVLLLAVLVSFDVFMQYSIATATYWNSYYELAVSSSPELWKIGFRIEDVDMRSLALESKLTSIVDIVKSMPNKRSHVGRNNENIESSIQLKSGDNINTLLRGMDFNHTKPAGMGSPLSSFSKAIENQHAEQISNNILLDHELHLQLHEHSGNISNIVTIHCDSDSDSGAGVLRVGLNDYRTDERNSCHLFEASNPKERRTNPHYMFEKIPLGDGAFGLKSVATKLFIRVVPPLQDSSTDTEFAQWGVALRSYTAGAYERFRHADDGRLFSSLLGGFLTCGGGDPVQGTNGAFGTYNRFRFQPVDVDNYEKSLELVALSDQLLRTQQDYVKHHQAEQVIQRQAAAFSPKEAGVVVSDTIRVGITIPVTSKGTLMESIKESPLWSNFFDTFMKSIDWRSNRICFRVYIGFDKADLIYDTGDAWSEMRDEFSERAAFRMKEQLMDDIAIHSVLRDTLSLKLMHFEGLQGAPSQVVSQLMLQSYADGFDYFYQVNDDTLIITPNWAADFIKTLQSNPLVPNFGVTGPTDLNNDRIFTHCFVHRTHVDVSQLLIMCACLLT